MLHTLANDLATSVGKIRDSYLFRLIEVYHVAERSDAIKEIKMMYILYTFFILVLKLVRMVHSLVGISGVADAAESTTNNIPLMRRSYFIANTHEFVFAIKAHAEFQTYTNIYNYYKIKRLTPSVIGYPFKLITSRFDPAMIPITPPNISNSP